MYIWYDIWLYIIIIWSVLKGDNSLRRHVKNIEWSTNRNFWSKHYHSNINSVHGTVFYVISLTISTDQELFWHYYAFFCRWKLPKYDLYEVASETWNRKPQIRHHSLFLCADFQLNLWWTIGLHFGLKELKTLFGPILFSKSFLWWKLKFTHVPFFLYP